MSEVHKPLVRKVAFIGGRGMVFGPEGRRRPAPQRLQELGETAVNPLHLAPAPTPESTLPLELAGQDEQRPDAAA